MKHALFSTQEEAESYVPTVQAAVDAAAIPGPKVIILPVYVAWLDKWAVALPVDCEEQGEIVETIEMPVDEEEQGLD